MKSRNILSLISKSHIMQKLYHHKLNNYFLTIETSLTSYRDFSVMSSDENSNYSDDEFPNTVKNDMNTRLFHNVEMWLDHSRNGLNLFFGAWITRKNLKNSIFFEKTRCHFKITKFRGSEGYKCVSGWWFSRVFIHISFFSL